MELTLEPGDILKPEDTIKSKGAGTPVITEPSGAKRNKNLVLIVEDDELSRELLSITLSGAGYRVASVSSGREALLLARELKPSVITLDIMLPEITLDIMLPGISGWDILKNLKKDSETADIPILVISMDDDRNCSILWGAFDHLTKPVEKECLLSSLQKVKRIIATKSSPQVLIVDNEPDIVDLFSSIIKQEEYEPICAYWGKEAIDKTINNCHDAILLDLMMSEFTGFDVVKALKGNPETIDIPIIVCTSKDLNFEEKELLNRRVSYVMRKGSVNREILLSMLHRMENEKFRKGLIGF